MVKTLSLDPIQVLAVSGVSVALGIKLNRTLSFLRRLNIPPSIVGGLIFAAAGLALRDRWLNLEFDSALRNVLLIASFATVGMNANLHGVRRGGVQVAVMAGLAITGAVLQGFLGVGLAIAFGIHPLVGILAGPMAFAGGPSNALAFGPMFESIGVAGATTTAVAAATFGIVVAGLVAGLTGGSLIRRSTQSATRVVETSRHIHVAGEHTPDPLSKRATLLTHVLLITCAMGAGSLLSPGLKYVGIVLPGFIGPMLMGVILRNLDERTKWFGVHQQSTEEILGVVLPMFIAMSMMTLKLWELHAIAGPLLAIACIQVATTWLFSAVITFRMLGADYEAAIMTAGFCGFMIGITPNALASMEELNTKFGSAPRAFLVVPIVGAVLLDVPVAIIITAFANFFRTVH
jgi:glutamate:Na+ symporter, ESS family